MKWTRPDLTPSGRSLLTLGAEPRTLTPVLKAPTRFFGLTERSHERGSTIAVDEALMALGDPASRHPASDED
jgi:hypothetical protein